MDPNLQNNDKLIEEALEEANQLENLQNKQVHFNDEPTQQNFASKIPNNIAAQSPSSLPSDQLCNINDISCRNDNSYRNDEQFFNQMNNVTPMSTLYDSLKWSFVVFVLLFVFSSPKAVGIFTSFVPSQLRIDNDLSFVGNIVYLIIPSVIFFALYHFLL